MANRQYRTQFSYSMCGAVVNAFAQITFGSSGAPTLNVGSTLISGIVRNSAGVYTITFRDVYQSFLMAKHVFNSGSAAPASPGMYIKTNSTNTTTKTIQIVFNSAGTATDPASGEIAYIQFLFNNSSITS